MELLKISVFMKGHRQEPWSRVRRGKGEKGTWRWKGGSEGPDRATGRRAERETGREKEKEKGRGVRKERAKDRAVKRQI